MEDTPELLLALLRDLDQQMDHCFMDISDTLKTALAGAASGAYSGESSGAAGKEFLQEDFSILPHQLPLTCSHNDDMGDTSPNCYIQPRVTHIAAATRTTVDPEQMPQYGELWHLLDPKPFLMTPEGQRFFPASVSKGVLDYPTTLLSTAPEGSEVSAVLTTTNPDMMGSQRIGTKPQTLYNPELQATGRIYTSSGPALRWTRIPSLRSTMSVSGEVGNTELHTNVDIPKEAVANKQCYILTMCSASQYWMESSTPNLLSLWNQTSITEFRMLGFQISDDIRMLTFFIFFTIYLFIVMGNLLIIILVLTCNHLHSPMYIFLSNLSTSEIFFTTCVVPNMLYVIFEGGGIMSVAGCLTQFYVFGSLISVECFLLAVMSYDRYLAICFPLRYHSLMDSRLCIQLAVLSWMLGFLLSVLTIVFVSHIYFCGSNIIDHFLCDFAPLLKLACSDTSIVELQVFIFSFSIIIFPFIFIVLTYISIMHTILLIPSITGRQKTFSTCSSHLTIVSTYYGTLMFMYSAPSISVLHDTNKILSLLYILVTPLCNPIVYSLRNRDIRKILERTFGLKHVCQ
ncbi:olfactory receptor 11A1-like [Bombina bombina]|uniref:olfactory receptor 11A1-like n=1 Tax=Bombina bombina TaxID=8345 RepID=UPI00235B08F5|nr:olfactory receptor 11A1-like [Bombina bombina]